MKKPASKKMMRLFLLLVLAGVSLAAVPVANAQSRQDLKERFKQRDPEISRLKLQGKIGETWQGYVDIVRDDKPLNDQERKLVDDENGDRRKLYAMIASKSDIRESPEEVGINNALRNFAWAKPDEYLKGRVGPWVTRGDVNRLKEEGKIGETWQGYVEAVSDKAASEPRVTAVINAENAARKYMYDRRARENRSTDDEEAQRAGRQNIDKAKAGEYVKGKDGKWVKNR